ncbi:unnamed protein product [Mucor hiemalis]
MFSAQNFSNSFSLYVQEADLNCCALNPPLALRCAHRPSTPLSLYLRVKKVTATTNAPAIIDEDIVMSFLPAHPSPGEDGFSPKSPTPLPLLPPNFLLHSLACLIT